MKENLLAHLEEAAPVLAAFVGDEKPMCALVLGSGFGYFAEALEDARVLPYKDVPHMPGCSATHHVGAFVIGRTPTVQGAQRSYGGQTILCMQGRLHGYEGLNAQEVAFPIWLMNRALGIKLLFLTNAAGAINIDYAVGDYCAMSDHINFTGNNPLAGLEPNQIASRFVPMNDAYDPALRQIAVRVAQREGIPMHQGVYLGLKGPSFETPAEIRAFANWGADTVAMSVIEEVIAARHVGMRVLSISLCSNMAAGVHDVVPNEDEVFEATQAREEDFIRLACGIIDEMAAE